MGSTRDRWRCLKRRRTLSFLKYAFILLRACPYLPRIISAGTLVPRTIYRAYVRSFVHIPYVSKRIALKSHGSVTQFSTVSWLLRTPCQPIRGDAERDEKTIRWIWKRDFSCNVYFWAIKLYYTRGFAFGLLLFFFHLSELFVYLQQRRDTATLKIVPNEWDRGFNFKI